jgi:hypothetical protein
MAVTLEADVIAQKPPPGIFCRVGGRCIRDRRVNPGTRLALGR